MLDKKRKRRQYQRQRAKSHIIRYSTVHVQTQKLNYEDLFGQSNSSKILEQGRWNVVNATSEPSGTDPRLIQQIKCTSNLQSHSWITEYRSRPSQSTEATSIRKILTNEIVQISPIRVEPSEIQDNRICSEAQQEIEEVLEFFFQAQKHKHWMHSISGGLRKGYT